MEYTRTRIIYAGKSFQKINCTLQLNCSTSKYFNFFRYRELESVVDRTRSHTFKLAGSCARLFDQAMSYTAVPVNFHPDPPRPDHRQATIEDLDQLNALCEEAFSGAFLTYA